MSEVTQFLKSSQHAAFNFNQKGVDLYTNHPRFPFEYYININLNNITTAKEYIATFFGNEEWIMIAPLVKSIEMPSIKIETTALNQYNRKRLSQSKMSFEPVKVVFHDVVDGKTLKFWEMYYRYYFADGSESGKNQIKEYQDTVTTTYTREQGVGGGQSTAAYAAKDPRRIDASPGTTSHTNTNGSKSSIQNIIAGSLDNHNFGFNLPTVKNIRNLIQTLDIYQVHGGRFNQVTLVNPRISAFTHDTLNYATSDKTLELTFTFEYEYAYYTIQNMKLGAGEENNSSTIEQFEHGNFLELPAAQFTTSMTDYVESNSQMSPSGDTIAPSSGQNTQNTLAGVTNAPTNTINARTTSSSYAAFLTDDTDNADYSFTTPPASQARSFDFRAAPATLDPDTAVPSTPVPYNADIG